MYLGPGAQATKVAEPGCTYELFSIWVRVPEICGSHVQVFIVLDPRCQSNREVAAMCSSPVVQGGADR